jgi:hypothetical protein
MQYLFLYAISQRKWGGGGDVHHFRKGVTNNVKQESWEANCALQDKFLAFGQRQKFVSSSKESRYDQNLLTALSNKHYL